MDTLPEDIIFYLCEFATDADDSKTLRLVQRKFSYPAAKNVFRNLVLYPHPDKWEKVASIAKDPSLAKLVRKVSVVRLVPDTCFSDVATYSKKTKDIRRKIGSHDAKELGIVSGLTDRQRHMTSDELWSPLHQAYIQKYYWDSYRKTLRWKKWFEAADASDWKIPYRGFNNLRHLESVESVGSIQLAALNRHKYGGRYAGFTRMEVETFAKSVEADWFDKYSHLNVFLFTLYRSGITIQNLTLGGLPQLDVGLRPQIGILYIRSLVLDLRDSGTEGAYTIPISIFGRMLFETLEKLTIIQIPEPRFGFNVLAMLSFHRLNMPKLRHLSLEHVTTTGEYIRRFLRQCLESLVQVQIFQPVVQPEVWAEIREEILLKELGPRDSRIMTVNVTEAYRPETEDITKWYSERELYPPY